MGCGGHRRKRVLDRCLACLRRGVDRQAAALSGKLRSGPRHRRDQPWVGRPCSHKRKARPQCQICRRWGWPRCARDGRGRLFDIEPVHIFRYRHSLRPNAAFALADRWRANDPERAHGGKAAPHSGDPTASFRELMRNRSLMIFAGCVALFHLANAAMLPLTASVVTMRSDNWAVALVGVCMLVPQLVVAAFAPWIGRETVRIGRRPLLLLGFGALTLRGVLLAFATSPYMLVAVQLLDGISAAVLAVLVPLIIADATRGTGHFNLAQGTVGTAVGIGASFSTILAGYTYDHFGLAPAFLGLAGLAGTGFIAVLTFMPETGGIPSESNEFPRRALLP